MQWMRDHPSDYVPFVPGGTQAFRDYLRGMDKEGTWGDNLTLRAMCGAFKASVFILKEGQEGDRLWVDMGDKVGAVHVFGLYLHNQHYENLVSRGQVSI